MEQQLGSGISLTICLLGSKGMVEVSTGIEVREWCVYIEGTML